MGDGLTLFTMPHVFSGIYGEYMNHALRSWTLLKPRPEIILFGDSPDIIDTARRLGCTWRPVVQHEKWGVPIVSDAIRQAQTCAKNRILCLVNTDIVLMQDFIDAVFRVAARFPKFLATGRRTHIEATYCKDFSAGWQGRLRATAGECGQLGNELGCDYFAFSSGLYGKKLVPFLVGRRVWHTWLVWYAREAGIPVVNTTEAILALHQRGEDGRTRYIKRRPDEVQYNKALVGSEQARLFDEAARTSKFPWILTANGDIQPKRRRK